MRVSHLLSLITGLIFLTVIGTPLFYLSITVYPYILLKTLFFQVLVELIFVLWLILIFIDKRYRPQLTILVRALILFVSVLFITSLFGVDFQRSFWSTYERMYGIFTILHLAVFALIISSLINHIPWRKLLIASVATCAFIDIVAILQTRVQHLLLNETVDRPGATFGNPTFFAGYLLFHLFLVMYFLLQHYRSGRESTNRRSVIFRFMPYVLYGSALFLNLFALLLTETRGDILGFILGFLVLIFLFFLSPPDLSGILARKYFYLGTLVFLIAIGTLFLFTSGSGFWANIPGLERFRNLSTATESLQPRLVALRSAWQGFLDKPLTGWGWENFNVVYNKYYDPRTLELNYEETRFDKPHNFFMEDLSTGGAPLALVHLALLMLFFAQSLRIRDRLFGSIVFAAGVAYFFQSLFIFDTLGPALLLFLLLGIVDGLAREEQAAVHEKPSIALSRAVPWKPAAFAFAVALILIYEVNIPSTEAGYWDWQAFSLLGIQPTQGLAAFDTALSFSSPYRSDFARDFATAITHAYFFNPGVIPSDAALRAISQMEEVAKEHPEDAYNHYALVDMYNQVSDLDPGRFLKAAEDQAAIALQLSPNRQEVYFSLAKTKTLEKDYQGALTLLQQALALDDKVPDAHFYYGIVAYAAGDQATGYRELETSITMGRQWQTFYEPRTVADFFADSGHLEEAIPLYKTSLDMASTDSDKTESQIKLGVAYYYDHQYDLARQYLREAGKSFDFTKSASYPSLKPILQALGL